VESISNRTSTRAERKELLATETNKSAITDHLSKKNHVIDWSRAKILDTKSHRKTRQHRESVHMRKEVNCMNRDMGEPTTCIRPMTVFW